MNFYRPIRWSKMKLFKEKSRPFTMNWEYYELVDILHSPRGRLRYFPPTFGLEVAFIKHPYNKRISKRRLRRNK